MEGYRADQRSPPGKRQAFEGEGDSDSRQSVTEDGVCRGNVEGAVSRMGPDCHKSLAAPTGDKAHWIL